MLDFSDFPSIKSPIGFFEEISKIPHGSGNTKGIADYIEKFAKERGLFCVRDSLDNIIIRKPATPGYESKPGVIFQGHTDMVAEKTPNANIDMQKEGLRLYRDGDFLRAEGTTLGGDDGIAVSYALAVLDADDIEHPEFEAVFTTDEEVGLTGAKGIDLSPLHGRMLINIDCDHEGTFTVGCAGGIRADISLPVTRENFSGYAYRITLGGLLGGHSGGDIDKGRQNAIKYLSYRLSLIPDARLTAFSGGNADNAIPRDADATVILASPISEEIHTKLLSETKKIKDCEPSATLDITEIDAQDIPLSAESSAKILSLITAEPNGVIGMSEDIEGLVETSLNLGIARLENNVMKIAYALRSSVETKKAELADRVQKIAESFGATVEWRGDYPGWAYRKDSYLRDKMSEVYRDMYGEDPRVIAIHAGLECGILIDKLPELDCVAFGPDNFDIHTPNEHLVLPSYARVWEYLKELLKRI